MPKNAQAMRGRLHGGHALSILVERVEKPTDNKAS